MSNIKLFETKKVRTHWSEEEQKWFFSVIDVIEILTDSPRPRKYWSALKTKLRAEGNELSQNLGQLKLRSDDGKYYKTDVADTETLLRIIQSIPSPKAEPFKQWLAKVGYERMQEIADPEQSLDRARENWIKLGRSEKWIQQRMTGQETRNKLTDYWKESGVEKQDEFAYLTNIIHSEWAGLTVKAHKNLKGLKLQNLRDHMTEAELIFTALVSFQQGKLPKQSRQKVLPKTLLQERKAVESLKMQGLLWNKKPEEML